MEHHDDASCLRKQGAQGMQIRRQAGRTAYYSPRTEVFYGPYAFPQTIEIHLDHLT